MPSTATAADHAALRDEALPLVRDLLRLDTTNGAETPAAVLLKEYLEAAGVACELVARDPDRANLVARIPGRGEGPSIALLGHTDVVPAGRAADWTHPPFSGHVDEAGWLWGRGAADMKNETATRAVTLALLARSGFQPAGDIVFIAESDEEDGAAKVGLEWLVEARPDIRTEYAINEGGGDRLTLADGRIAVLIGVGEKRTLPVAVTALGEAAHASRPTAGANAVPRLARLVERLAGHRPEGRLLPVTATMLEVLTGGPVDDLATAARIAAALHPSFEHTIPALLGTTVAPTQLTGSAARNVMPGRATVTCDCRLLPDTGAPELEAELRAVLGADVPYDLEFLAGPLGGTVSPLDTPLYEAIRAVLQRHDPEAVLVPTMTTRFTDSHFLREAFGTVAYGFWPLRHTPAEVVADGIHNRDERLHVDDLGYAVAFHLDVVRRIAGQGG